MSRDWKLFLANLAGFLITAAFWRSSGAPSGLGYLVGFCALGAAWYGARLATNRIWPGMPPNMLGGVLLAIGMAAVFLGFVVDNGIHFSDVRRYERVKRLVRGGKTNELYTAITNDAKLAEQKPGAWPHRSWTPLFTAAYEGQTEAARVLIETGHANVDARDDDGNSPLHFAAWRGKAGVARVLLESGAKVNAVNKSGETPLFQLANASPSFEGQRETAQILLAHGADPNLSNAQGVSPMKAAERHRAWLAQVLKGNATRQQSPGDLPKGTVP